MVVITDLKKTNTESELQYIWRICSSKDSGILEMTWREIADVLNSNLRDDDDGLDESAYRKKYQMAKSFYEEVFSKMKSEEYSTEIANLKRELERKKIQYRDERNAWQKQNYIDARIETKLDILEEKLSDIGKINFGNFAIHEVYGENDLICCLSDLHIGQTFDTVFGEYNTEIAKQRLSSYLAEIIKIGNIHGSESVFVNLLGDQISGNIHHTIQVSNKENVIDQIKLASEYIANFCYELSKHFTNVFIVGVAGNHSRLIDNKEKAVHDERLDTLITWIVEKMTSHIDNIHVIDNTYDSGISEIIVRGNSYIGVHGDLDSMNKNAISNLVMLLGFFPYAILSGHKHYPSYTEFNGVKMIQSGTLAGSGDSYTIEKRLCGEPNQTVLVCSNKGIDCIYNVNLK